MPPVPASRPAPRGRRREAERNDERLLLAAHEALSEVGWNVSVAEIARRADIGIGSFYRRYRGKVSVAQHVRVVCMERLSEAALAAAEEEDGWQALVRFMRDAVSTPTSSLLPLIGGVLPATPAVDRASDRLRAAIDALLERARSEGALRQDVGAADLVLLLVHLRTRLPGLPERIRQLRLRYLHMALDGMRATVPPERSTLPQPCPEWQELRLLWDKQPDTRARPDEGNHEG
ncbi:TetR/AcrR family transcriptional regulator [Streptomyces populi]|uniref:TetR/AcrR family transcriptional regulator n=1 Tax=Streptomyces populi TaxID=2058924 RepID=A0A2I0SVW6_9ACTN|nr:TetR/AcrR family transcriptional regulator [Streptomyces populi]PKT74078.1 TetR/AcrR family transcriptional regulator [Streptomyces populi]